MADVSNLAKMRIAQEPAQRLWYLVIPGRVALHRSSGPVPPAAMQRQIHTDVPLRD